MFVYSASLSSARHSIYIYTVAIKNIKKMHAVLTNQIADFLHFKDNSEYIIFIFLISPT